MPKGGCIMEKHNGVEKIKIILDRKNYEIGKLFTESQLKRLCGCDNEAYGICLIIPLLPKCVIFAGKEYGFKGGPDLEITDAVHDAGLFSYYNIPLKFYSYSKLPMVEHGLSYLTILFKRFNGKLWPHKILTDGSSIPFGENEERLIWNQNWQDSKGNPVGHDPKEGDKIFIQI